MPSFDQCGFCVWGTTFIKVSIIPQRRKVQLPFVTNQKVLWESKQRAESVVKSTSFHKSHLWGNITLDPQPKHHVWFGSSFLSWESHDKRCPNSLFYSKWPTLTRSFSISPVRVPAVWNFPSWWFHNLNNSLAQRRLTHGESWYREHTSDNDFPQRLLVYLCVCPHV